MSKSRETCREEFQAAFRDLLRLADEMQAARQALDASGAELYRYEKADEQAQHYECQGDDAGGGESNG
jgi:hypothetical protein